MPFDYSESMVAITGNIIEGESHCTSQSRQISSIANQHGSDLQNVTRARRLLQVWTNSQLAGIARRTTFVAKNQFIYADRLDDIDFETAGIRKPTSSGT